MNTTLGWVFAAITLWLILVLMYALKKLHEAITERDRFSQALENKVRNNIELRKMCKRREAELTSVLIEKDRVIYELTKKVPL